MLKSEDLDISLNAIGQQQQQFIQSLFRKAHPSDGKHAAGLNIYRQNVRATAINALSISFPTVHQLIGDKLFGHAAIELLLKEPPTHGDWAQWGGGFATLLENLKQLEDYPYVAECARLELAIHQVEKAKDSAFDFISANLLSDVALDQLRIELADAVAIIESDFPLIELWEAHHGDNKQQSAQAFKQQVNQTGFKQFILIYRPQFKAKLRALTEYEFFWMSRLIRGKSVGRALDLMESSDFRFEQWLPAAIEQNLLTSFHKLN